MDPGDLYNDLQMSLADCLASGKVKPDKLDGTYHFFGSASKKQKPACGGLCKTSSKTG